MSEKRCYLKRTIQVGERLSFDGGRFWLLIVGKTGNAAAISLDRGDGKPVARSLFPNETLMLDGGRIAVTMHRRTGNSARFLVDMAASVRIAPPSAKAAPDAPASANDVPPQFGGYL